MSTTALREDAQPSRSLEARLPWPSLIVLGAGTLVMVTSEMLPAAVLGPMSAGLGVPEPSIAQLVSIWAAVVVVASFPLVRLTRNRDRRLVITLAMVALAVSSGFTAAAPSYAAAVAGRLVGAVAVGLLWATVNAYVADLVSDRLLGAAVSVVIGGASLGMVLGTPLARLVADLAGWRTAFAALAVLGLVVAILIRLVVARPGERTAEADSAAPAERRAGGSLAATLVVTGLVALVLVGHYGAYTFITRIAEAAAGVLPGQVSTLLLGFGIASALGVAIAGRVGERTHAALVVSVVLTAAALLALLAADASPGVGLLVVVIWGVVSGALPPLAQTEILRLAGTTHRATAGALIPVLFNGGIAVGAGLAALLVEHAGVTAVPVPAAVVVASAAIGLVAVAHPLRRRRARASVPVEAPGVAPRVGR